MPIRYEMATLVVPASGSDRQRILTVPEGKKIQLRAIAVYSTSGYEEKLFLDETEVMDVASGNAQYFGNFLPLDDAIAKPTNIDVEVTDLGSTGVTMYITLMYEE